MATLSARQSVVPSPSGRAAMGHLGQAQQPRPLSLSSRALAGSLGVGRRYTDTTSLLTPRRLALPAPPLPDFNRLRADYLRMQQQVAAHDNAQPTPRGITPAQAGYPIPFLTPAEQARRQAQDQRARQQLVQRLLADYNRLSKPSWLDGFSPLRKIEQKAVLSMLQKLNYKPKTKSQVMVSPNVPTGSGLDLFMPKTFWHTQAPNWYACCDTVKKMFTDAKYREPSLRMYIVKEKGKDLVPAKDFVAGIEKLDNYLANHKPVMAGVTHTFGMTIKSKKTGIEYPLNEGTTDHFIAIVGTGVEKGRKYYRFFDVGTADPDRGMSPLNRLYLNGKGLYVGESQATYKTYTISQLRF